MTTDLIRRPGAAIDDDTKHTYISMYLLKKLDLDPKDGGLELPVVLPAELSPIDEPLQQLAVEGMVEIDRKKARWVLTKAGIAYLGELIDEASALVEEFDEAELEEAVEELRARKLDVYRARFLWGWYDGEFDDLVLFQQRRGITPVERMWAFYLTGDDLWRELARDIE